MSEIQKSDDHDKGEPAGCNFGGVVTFGVGLVAGTFSAVVCKMLYETTSTGLDGTSKLFSKPIMVLLLMFTSMVPAIFFYVIQQSLLPKDKRDEPLSPKTLVILMIPSICDLLCTLLLLIAQLYITASMWQMLRGSVIIITAILKKVVLKHSLRAHMWTGKYLFVFYCVILMCTINEYFRVILICILILFAPISIFILVCLIIILFTTNSMIKMLDFFCNIFFNLFCTFLR